MVSEADFQSWCFAGRGFYMADSWRFITKEMLKLYFWITMFNGCKWNCLVVWNIWIIFPLLLGIYNHPNWRTPSFFRGVGIPPTSIHLLRFRETRLSQNFCSDASFRGKNIGDSIPLNKEPVEKFAQVRCMRMYQSPNATRQSSSVSIITMENDTCGGSVVMEWFSWSIYRWFTFQKVVFYSCYSYVRLPDNMFVGLCLQHRTSSIYHGISTMNSIVGPAIGDQGLFGQK